MESWWLAIDKYRPSVDTLAALLKEWIQDRGGEALARSRLTDAYERKGETATDIPPWLMSWTRLSIMLNSLAGLDTDQFTAIREGRMATLTAGWSCRSRLACSSASTMTSPTNSSRREKWRDRTSPEERK
jgi:hypothetical protein